VNNSLQSTLATIQEAYSEGKLVQFGLSNYATWEVVFIYYYMKERGWVLPTVYQGMYNAITREVEADLLPALKRLNISFYAYNPLAGGMLSGKHTKASAAKLDEGRFNKDSFWGQKYRERYIYARHPIRRSSSNPSGMRPRRDLGVECIVEMAHSSLKSICPPRRCNYYRSEQIGALS
jgi:aryl-alcohol dehydrogenase-like predicted oxidoreductase